MDYERTCLEMMLDLGGKFSPDKMFDLVFTLSHTIAGTLVLIEDQEKMKVVLDHLCEAMKEDAVEQHEKFHQFNAKHKEASREAGITAREFLEKFYNPRTPNA